MSEKHTPVTGYTRRLWRLRKMLDGSFHVYGEGEYDIIFPRIGEEPDANARLIESAPDMAETIEEQAKEIQLLDKAFNGAMDQVKDLNNADIQLHTTIDRQAKQIERLRSRLEMVEKAGLDIADMAQDFIHARDINSLRNYGNNIASIARAALAESEQAQPKVAVNLPGGIAHTLIGAEAKQFIIDHGLEHTDSGSDVTDHPVAPPGG